MPKSHLQAVAKTAPWRYKVFTIPKRRGDGVRVVAQPSRELKAIQREITSLLLSKLPVHDCAHGYVRNRGIRSNAEQHLQSRFMLKLDLTDFFPSIRPPDFETHVHRHLSNEIDESELRLISRLLFWAPKGSHDLRLCIGAPSSPALSNTVVFDMDVEISDRCRELGVNYTRYADDLTLSATEPNILSDLERVVGRIISQLEYPRLRLNREKFVHTSMARRRVVTGLVITNEGQVSIGRERKRLIRAMAHRASLGQLDDDEVRRLEGMLSFAASIEPEFVAAVKQRFSWVPT